MVIARRVAILGATKGMGRALARACAARNEQLCLLGRDLAELEKSVHDLQVRGATTAAFAYCDLADPGSFAGALEAAVARLGGLDVVVVTAAAFATQAQLDADPARIRALLTVDFTNTILFCEVARRTLLSAGSANPTLCVFSSVAGERGRKPVIFYGAAKAGLTRYLEAIDHTFHADGLRVVCVKPGFVRTSMTEGLPAPPFAGEPDAVAARVLTALDRGTPVVYVPSIWALVMAVIRLLPRAVMRRIDF
ncbi:MAG TPA: SDR family NAD(P)-dependent oxidoreductase [Vicinamibacterales bacterium]|jgi:short-subunit dehydrogenase|nr:SDR family NAD(P)-dependent oxidoreductase [Vicinamibacterales bacterium]